MVQGLAAPPAQLQPKNCNDAGATPFWKEAMCVIDSLTVQKSCLNVECWPDLRLLTVARAEAVICRP